MACHQIQEPRDQEIGAFLASAEHRQIQELTDSEMEKLLPATIERSNTTATRIEFVGRSSSDTGCKPSGLGPSRGLPSFKILT